MRSEQEMLDLILGFAGEQENIRAVYMNGSRTNPNVPKDILQDFDIVYVVRETKPFIEDKSWIRRFGEIAIMQEPDDSALFVPERDASDAYGYLMQFADGNRIDLTLQTIEVTKLNYLSDKLTLPLLDKDHILPEIPAASDEDYHVKKPSESEYLSCCNEFWWVSPYIAKGLWRNELLYAMDHFNLYVRPMLLNMLGWKAGIITNFSKSIGKNGKYLEQFLEPQVWRDLLSTYPCAEREAMWEALFHMCRLFAATAKEVAEGLGYNYRLYEEKGTVAYLNKIRFEMK